MKWLKRILVLGLVVAVGFVALGLIARHLAKQRPEWYPASAPDPAAIKAAGATLQNKFLAIRNWAAETQARENTARAGRESLPTDPTTAPAASWTLTLPEAELNSFFLQWDEILHLSDKYSKFIENPVLVIRDGRLILAGTVKDLDTLVSVHFEPKLDDSGMLHLDVARVMGGSLPLPQALWSGYRDRLTTALDKKLEKERKGAKIANDGTANGEAVAAGMNELLMHALRGEPADPILFLPHDFAHWSNAFPVKVTAVQVVEKSLTLTVQGLTPPERAALLQKIRDAGNTVTEKVPGAAVTASVPSKSSPRSADTE